MPEYRVLLPQLKRHPKGAGKRRGIRGLVRSGDQGFSIIEVLVAIGIFAVIASFMAQTLAVGMRGVLLGKRREIATQEANRMLEIARSLSYNAIGLIQTDPTIASDSAIEAHSGKLSYLANSTWEPLAWSTKPSGHPFNPHIQSLTRGSTELIRHIYVTGVNTDSEASTFELKRVIVQVSWSGGGTAGPENSVRAQTLINENGLILDGGGPLTAETFATGGSLKINSALLGLSAPLDIKLPSSTGDSTFRAVSTTNCTTKSASLAALNLVDLPGYSVTTTADDDSRTATPPNPPPASNSGILTIPLGPVANLLGAAVNSPVACEATTDPFGHEEGTASALSALNANANVPLLGLPLLPWVLNLANVQSLPVSQEINHELVSGQREVAASAGASTGAVNLLKIAGVIPDGLFMLDAITYGASVRGAEGTPSGAPTITSPTFNLRVFDASNQLGGGCAAAVVPGVTASRSGAYCVLTVNPLAAGFTGLSIDLNSSFLQNLGLLLPVVNLTYSVKLDILPPAKSPIAGVTGPNGEKRWSAEYTPASVSASLDATLLGTSIIDADVDLNLGTVSAKACSGATC
jgi:prepilin-type N-terminal cleavage/methylation domain-containing protein